MKKRKIIIVVAVLCFAYSIHAQSAFEKGTSLVKAGIGIGSSIFSYSGSSQTPAISAQFEKGIWEIGGPGVISLGGYVGTKSYKYHYTNTYYDYTAKWNYTIIGIRSAYHYTGLKNSKADLYGGLMLSYNHLKYKFEDENGGTSGSNGFGSYGSGTGITAYVGGNYLFTGNIGAFGELGYGVSYLTLGLTVKF